MQELNEGRHQVKRKYGDYNRIRVNENGAHVRDTIIKYVGKNYVTEEDLHNHLIRHEEDRGGAKVNKATWFKRNQKFFTTFEKKGTSYYSLSKYGQRVYEMILKRDTLPKEINESKYRNIPSLSESIALDELYEAKDLKVGDAGVDYNDTTVKVLKIGKFKSLIKEWEKKQGMKASDMGFDTVDPNENFYLVEITEDGEGGDKGDYAMYPVKYDMGEYWGLDPVK